MAMIGRDGLERILSSRKRERAEFARLNIADFEAEIIVSRFARTISLLLLVVGFAVCDVYDVTSGVLTVTQYSWWGLKKNQLSFPPVADIKISVLISHRAKGPSLSCLVIEDKESGKIAFRSYRTAWSGYKEFKETLSTAMQNRGCCHERCRSWLAYCSMWAVGLFISSFIFACRKKKD